MIIKITTQLLFFSLLSHLGYKPTELFIKMKQNSNWIHVHNSTWHMRQKLLLFSECSRKLWLPVLSQHSGEGELILTSSNLTEQIMDRSETTEYLDTLTLSIVLPSTPCCLQMQNTSQTTFCSIFFSKVAKKHPNLYVGNADWALTHSFFLSQ